MKRFPLSAFLATLALLTLLCAAAPAFEVTEADTAGPSPFTATVRAAPDPALVGYFGCGDDAAHPFAYALIKRDGAYALYVKVAQKFQGFVKARLDGDVIVFGKDFKGRIALTDEGIHRTFMGKFKTPLHKMR